MGTNALSLLFDPKFFNYLIMILYILNAGRWAFQGNWADMFYWLSAFSITATVTFGYAH
jgi:hypothetical protein